MSRETLLVYIMGIETKHPALEDVLDDIQTVKDNIKGSRHIKAQKEFYLPTLEGQESDDYEVYLKRAFYLNATKSTLSGFRGSVFRKAITHNLPDNFPLDFLNNIDGEGQSLTDFAQQAFNMVASGGRAGIWVSKPSKEKPSLILVESEDIINWHQVEKWCVFSEYHRQGTDKYSHETRQAYREIALNDFGYDVNVKTTNIKYNFDESNTEPDFDNGMVSYKDMHSKQEKIDSYEVRIALPELPVVPMTPSGINWDPSNIPLISLAEANLDHYRLSADLRHGLHTAPFPVFWAAGFPETKILRIGSDVAWTAQQAAAQAGVLEYEGKALEFLLSAIANTEKAMVGFGARMLDESKRSSETAEALRIRQAAQEVTILDIAGAVGQGISKALWLATILMGHNFEENEIRVQLPQDLVDTRMSGDDLIAMVTSWIRGGMSSQALEYNMRQGELLPEHIDPEEYVKELEEQREKAQEQPIGKPGDPSGGDI